MSTDLPWGRGISPSRSIQRPEPVQRWPPCKPAIIRIVVVCSAPLGPRNPTISPRPTVKETPMTVADPWGAPRDRFEGRRRAGDSWPEHEGPPAAGGPRAPEQAPRYLYHLPPPVLY